MCLFLLQTARWYVVDKKIFTSKANTLKALASCQELHVPPMFIIDAAGWTNDCEKVLRELKNFARELRKGESEGQQYFSHNYAVRSSSAKEDTAQMSGAGAFVSLLHIPMEVESHRHNMAMRNAIEAVFDSYGQRTNEDQVLIQPMLLSVLSGVITTKVLADGAPYYVVNYDDESGKTDTVTSGAEGSKTVFVYKDVKASDFDSHRLYSFIQFARRLEQLCHSDELDIEFCLDQSGKIWLLQVRPLCTQHDWIIQSKEKVFQHIGFVIDFLEEKMSPQDNVYGNTTILGCMPDWNPAEMIGVTPRLLASTLYRHFITHRTWALAREKMGYRLASPDELMVLLAGRPFIDVRQSFNSFLPADISPYTAEVLVNAWLDRLNNYPQLHDKVEFEIATTVMTFDFDHVFQRRYPNLLSSERYNQYKKQLTELTASCLNLENKHNSMDWAYDAVIELSIRQENRKRSLLENSVNNASISASKLLSKIIAYAEECQQLGTLPFAILARHGFIAEALLRSAVACGAITKERVAEFKVSIQTISGIMSYDFQQVHKEKNSVKSFLDKYGHLRPNTYDILSPCYKEREGLFDGSMAHPHIHSELFEFTEAEQRAISHLLSEANLPTSIENFEKYIRKAIAGREFAKFVFTKSISDILENIALVGQQYGLDKEMLSYISFHDIIAWSSHALLRKPQEYFYEKYLQGKELYDIGRSLKLSYIIRSPRDIFVVPQHRNTPNFIGKGCIEKEIILLDSQTSCKENLDDLLVCIENADPGFDWIFTRSIAGLITKFGGTNSHMAIRCAEYGLPAAIGVGEVLFAQVTKSKRCILNIDANVIQAQDKL